jgi:hypothetical protein
MPQLNLYVSDAVARDLKRAAKKARKSLSAYVAERLTQKRETASKWPKEFLELEGSWEGRFPEPSDSPPDEIEPL